MTREEFSNGFSTLLNSYANQANVGEQSSRADIVLDEYEKSLFLTQAQEQEVLSLYTGKNADRESFEATEKLRKYLAPLIVEYSSEPIVNSSGNPIGMEGKNSYFFSLPDGSEEGIPAVWFITYEAVSISSEDKCKDGVTLDVYPVKQDEYHKIRKNPFRGANDRRALRLDLSDDIVEIISKYTVTSYYIRYLRRLTPIILETLADGVSIDGKYEAMDCKLPKILHQRILERAVMLALRSKRISVTRPQSTT